MGPVEMYQVEWDGTGIYWRKRWDQDHIKRNGDHSGTRMRCTGWGVDHKGLGLRCTGRNGDHKGTGLTCTGRNGDYNGITVVAPVGSSLLAAVRRHPIDLHPNKGVHDGAELLPVQLWQLLCRDDLGTAGGQGGTAWSPWEGTLGRGGRWYIAGYGVGVTHMGCRWQQ